MANATPKDAAPAPLQADAIAPYDEEIANIWSEYEDEFTELARFSKSANTWEGYESDWRQFQAWALERHGKDLPGIGDDGLAVLDQTIRPELIVGYIIDNQYRLRSATLTRHLSAIKHHHVEAGLPDPTGVREVRKALDSVTRRHQYKPRQAGAIRLSQMQSALAHYDLATIKGLRDAALLCFGWWSARRRSELVRMTIEDVEYRPLGLVLTVPYSKTDQTGAGAKVPINHQHETDCPDLDGCTGHGPCPVCLLREWVAAASISSGPIWRSVDRWEHVGDKAISGQSVSLILKDAVTAAGMNAAPYSSHSLRAGFVSSMDDHNVPRAAIRSVTLHQTEASMDDYSRPDLLLRDGAGAYLQ